MPQGLGFGGGSGFSLGPLQNEFTDNSARNTYATANATWLAQYNGDRAFWIRVGGAAGAIQRRNSAGTDWETVTGIVSGRDGNVGHQGRFEISIHTNSAAQPTPSTPVGGTYNLDTGAFAPPTGTTEDPTPPGTGEDIWLSQAEIDPENQTGTVTPIWSEWIERSHLSAGIAGVTAGAGLSGGGTSGVVSVSMDVAAADFPTIPIGKGGTGEADVAAARAALAVLTQAQVDARAVARFSDAEKTKLGRLMVGAVAVDLGSVTLSSDRLTAAAPSGYIHYTDVTLLIFRVGTHPDPNWVGNLDFYVGSDRYDLHKSGEGDITYSDFRTDTSYLAVAHNNAVQLLGPFDPTDAQVGDRAFSNPPSNLTDTEKTAVRTAIDVQGGGFTLRAGAGIPAATLGADGDWYLRTTNGAMYQKGSGAWLLIYTDQIGQAGTFDGVLDSLGLTISGSDIVATAGLSVGNDVVSGPLTLPFLPLAGGTLAGTLSGLAATFSGLVSAATAPTADEHLANKAYVDAAVAVTPMSNHNRYLALGSDAVFTEAEYTGGTRFNSDAVTFPTFTGSMFPGIVVPATNPVTTFTQLGTFDQDLTSFFTQLADRNIGGVLHQEWVGTQAFPDSYSGIMLRVT